MLNSVGRAAHYRKVSPVVYLGRQRAFLFRIILNFIYFCWVVYYVKTCFNFAF